ncbi:hypothetical protein E4191_03805 [Paracoccus liaowanqingii]|uniref:Peptidase S8/S53 domain-containing protein n=1 Tax=Paracoccus liaowanqingii TaxID=2560053 RepID=A0A4P7HJY1_9RHOB|nr:hypothetical protein [Paracoccus liaowanqingii]QBX33930.1 hypothetical protein E4191_03805 [Paracoccus liaowanqingii]
MAHPPDPDRATIVAVIDHAIPFAHPLFTTREGHSRVAAIWLMEAQAVDRRPDIAFGRELRGPQIDALRRPDDPHAAYRACGLMTAATSFAMAHAGSHGAAVAALAAGHDPTDDRGRAVPILAVSLPQSALADTTGSLAGLFIQSAIVFVIARARALAREMSAQAGRTVRPSLVVNLSLGVTAGADDGSARLTRLQDAIATRTGWELGPIFFVLPTGNHRQDRLRGRLDAGQEIGWHIPPADPTLNAIEIWGGPGEALPQVEVATPDGTRLVVPLTTTGSGRITDANGTALARVVLQRRGGSSGRPVVTIIVPPTLPAAARAPCAPPGLWHLRLIRAGPSGCDLAVHRDDRLSGFRGQGRQSRLVEPSYAPRTDSGRWQGADDPATVGLIRRNGTANVYARGRRQIRVGASLARPAGQISAYTGLLPDGAPGDVTAPADTSFALPGLRLPGIAPASRQRLSGTSLSAPQLCRWLSAALADGARIFDRDTLLTALGPDGGAPDFGVPDLAWRCVRAD